MMRLSKSLLLVTALLSVLVRATTAEAADENKPITCTSSSAYPRTRPYVFELKQSTQVVISISQLADVRIIGVLDNACTGEHIPLIWDPLESPRLSYTVTLQKGIWHTSFRSDYLYRTKESSDETKDGRKYIISYRAVTKCKTPTIKDNECVCEEKPDTSGINILLRPTNTFDYFNSQDIISNTQNHKSDILVHIAAVAGLNAAPQLTLSTSTENRCDALQSALTLRLAGSEDGQAPKEVGSAIAGMGASEWRAATGRSFSDSVPQLAVDLFGILAEIAFERAKAKSFAILTERAQKLVCEQLTRGKVLADLQNEKKATAAALDWLVGDNTPLLPQTCETVRGLRIQEIATAGKSIYTAIVRDITTFALYTATHDIQKLREVINAKPKDDLSKYLARRSFLDLVNKIETDNKNTKDLQKSSLPIEDINQLSSNEKALKYLILDILQTLNNNLSQFLTNGSALTERDVQLAFLSFAKNYGAHTAQLLKDQVTDTGDLICPIRLGLAIIGECQSRGGCDAAAISQYLQKPQYYLRDASCDVERAALEWPGIGSFISRGLEVIHPAKARPANVQLDAMASLIFDVVEYTLQKKKVEHKFPLSKPALKALRDIVHGALLQEAQKVLIGFVELMGTAIGEIKAKPEDSETRKTLAKFSALAAGVASYAQNYPSNDEQLDAKQAQEQRAARKKAIESMMALTTNRSERAGDFIVSLGILPGVMLAGGQVGAGLAMDEAKNESGEIPNAKTKHVVFTQLTLPTGIAMQWLPAADKIGGGHLQISFLDLAQFVSFDSGAQLSVNNVKWADFVSIGLQGGALLGKGPNSLFFLGADVRYAPSISFYPAGLPESESRRGVFRAGLSFGYYVPIFDFN